MIGLATLLAVTGGLTAVGIGEHLLHQKNLRRIPLRIHVNGTRGKSSVTRLIAAGLRQSGRVTCAKTTGSTARMLLPDAREVAIFRPAGANIIEQKRIVATAAAYNAEALVIECMALIPELQSLCEFKLIRATHAVITNARPDHLDVMGPRSVDVAKALCGMLPPGGRAYTAERDQLEVLKAAARDRKCSLEVISDDEVEALDPESLAKFRYTEHPENVALALRVLDDVGVDRELALSGMQAATPDPGALSIYEVEFFGRKLHFFNGFAANDPVSSEQLWRMACERFPEVERRIAIFNCRADRPERSIQLGRALGRWLPADYAVLTGSGTYLFARSATKAGYDGSRLVFAEGLPVEEVFERTLSLVDDSATIVGLGNIGGQGLPLVRYFRNRGIQVSNDA